MKIYVVETYDDLLDWSYVEPTCYMDKEDAIRRAQSQTYTDQDGIRHWATFKKLDVVGARAEMSYEDALILLDELGLTERTCKMESFINPQAFEKVQEYTCTACGHFTIAEQLGEDDDKPNYCQNCGARVVD